MSSRPADVLDRGWKRLTPVSGGATGIASRDGTTKAAGAAQRERAERALSRVRRMSSWMDSRFRLPGTSVKFGFDTLIGLVPVAGDTATLLIGLLPVVESVRLGVRKRATARMLMNLGVDWVVGLVPGVDLVLDTAFKAHLRNARLLERELAGRLSGGNVTSAGRGPQQVPRP